MIPSDNLCRRLLAKASTDDVATRLRDAGFIASRNRLEKLRREMLSSGEAQPIDQAGRGPTPTINDPTIDARTSTIRLGERINALYEREAARLGCTPEAAMKLLNYSPIQLQRMAA